MSDVAIIIVVMSSGLAFTLGFVFGRVTGARMSDMTPEMFEQLPSTRIRRLQEKNAALEARLAEVEADRDEWKAAYKACALDTFTLTQRAERAEAALATARRDALEETAEVATRMEREMEIQDECGYEPFYTPKDVAHRIRALIAQEEPTT